VTHGADLRPQRNISSFNFSRVGESRTRDLLIGIPTPNWIKVHDCRFSHLLVTSPPRDSRTWTAWWCPLRQARSNGVLPSTSSSFVSWLLAWISASMQLTFPFLYNMTTATDAVRSTTVPVGTRLHRSSLVSSELTLWYTLCLEKGCQCFFLNNSVKRLPILACDVTIKLDVNDYCFVHLTLTLLLRYFVKCRSRILAVYNSECILVSHASARNIIARPQNHWKSAVTRLTTSCRICFASKSVVPRSRTWTNWNDASTVNGPLCVTQSLNVLSTSGVSVEALALVLVEDIFSTCCNK